MDNALLHWGSIGWEEDSDTKFYDLGDKTNDGHTLVKVQLFEGKDPTTEVNPKRAQGTRIICHISGGQRIPPKDTRCMVAIPAGMEMTPGGGLIIGTVEQTLDGRLSPQRTVMDFGDQHVVIKGKSVTVSGNDGSFVAVGTPKSGGTAGVSVQASDGTGCVFQKGVAAMYTNNGGDMPSCIELTVNGINIVYKGGAQFTLDPTGFVLNSPQMGIVAPSVLALGALLPGGYKPVVTAFLPSATPIVNTQILFSSTT